VQYTLEGSNPNALQRTDDSSYSPANDKLYQNTGTLEESDHPRLYLNDGDGNFLPHEEVIPNHVRTIAGTIAVEDYDGDGQQDIFIGGRVSKNFPLAPLSYLLKNNGGTFTDVTKEIAPDLRRPGMVTSATWSNLDEDSNPDLILAGEWMPIRFFRCKEG
jgi:hypothetical protein